MTLIAINKKRQLILCSVFKKLLSLHGFENNLDGMSNAIVTDIETLNQTYLSGYQRLTALSG